MLTPRIIAEESWDQSGDVDVWFLDRTSYDLRSRINRELNEQMAYLDKDERSIYYVEKIIDHILLGMRKSSNLRINQRTKQWVWAEEVSYVKSRSNNYHISQC